MKQNRRSIRIAGRKSVFNKYLISYASIALIGCLLVGMILLYSSANEINATERREAEELIHQAIVSLDAFEETMMDIAGRVRIEKLYDRTYFAQSVFREVEMIEHFAKFKDYSPMIDQYFLYYPQIDAVYTKSTKCRNFDMFCRYQLKTNAADQLMVEMMDQGLNRWHESEALPGNYFYAKPLQMKTETVLLVFIQNRKAMEEQLNRNAGVIDERKLTLHLLSQESLETKDIVGITQRKSFSVSMDASNRYFGIRKYLTTGIVWVILIMTLLLVAAVFAAYHSYLPISRLMYKYIPSDLNEKNSEWDVIEETLLTILRDKSKTQRQVQKMIGQIHDQQYVLRRYFVDELLNGSVSETLEYALQMTGIDFSREYFMLIMVDGRRVLDMEQINATMESLSDESMYLFCVNLPEEKTVVFVNMRDADNVLYVMEIMESIFEKSQLHYSEVLSSLAQMNIAWQKMNDKNPEETFGQSMELMASDIRQGDSESALKRLRILMNFQPEQSEMEQRGAYLAVIRCIYGLARECKITLSTECTKNILLVDNEDQFISVVTPVIYELASAACQEIDDEDARRIIDCIDDNLGNYELSRDWVAEACGMSEYVVGKIFKNIFKMSYTDYVRIRRLNKAKELLVNTNMTVNAIGNSLGYINISYFIRAFKEIVGMTPTMYRTEGKINKSDVHVENDVCDGDSMT